VETGLVALARLIPDIDYLRATRDAFLKAITP
jgi:hypothetical protein